MVHIANILLLLQCTYSKCFSTSKLLFIGKQVSCRLLLDPNEASARHIYHTATIYAQHRCLQFSTHTMKKTGGESMVFL